MLWDKSKAAAQYMFDSSLIKDTGSGDSTIDSWSHDIKKPMMDDVPENSEPVTTARKKTSSSLQYTLSRLQKKAVVQKSKRDIDGAIESTKIILELRRASLAKKEQANRDCSKEKKHVADTLVSLAYVVLIKEATKEAEAHFKEAAELYKSSGIRKEDDCMQKISRELDRLRWQQKCTTKRKEK